MLLHVIAESGSWEKHGLNVDYKKHIGSVASQEGIQSGDIEFVSGNHVSTYGLRARGSDWVYLGQTVNRVNHQLVTRYDTGIQSVADLKGRRVGTSGSHPTLNNWLYLKQRGLDLDRDDFEFVSQSVFKPGTMDEVATDKTVPPLWHWVRDGVVDAALIGQPSSLFAAAAGLKVIDVEPLPMIQYTTISTSLRFVEKRPDVVERFLKGIIEGIHFFKTQPEMSIDIIQKKITKGGQLTREQAAYTHQCLASTLESKLYPRMASIANVFEEAVRHDKDAAKINPMELWDLHHVRRIDDSGFIDRLYARPDPLASGFRNQPLGVVDTEAVVAQTEKGAPMPDHTCDETCAGQHD
jgi:ABC-type nitrate/sulfonate/bicarbonate transport system substrate-binding protein